MTSEDEAANEALRCKDPKCTLAGTRHWHTADWKNPRITIDDLNKVLGKPKWRN